MNRQSPSLYEQLEAAAEQAEALRADIDSQLPESHVNTNIVKMSWAMLFSQVKEGVIKLSNSWRNQKGLERLMLLLHKKGGHVDERVFLGYEDDVRVIDSSAQVNMLPIGGITDVINDWYGAMGTANLKVCVRGYSKLKEGQIFFVVDKLGYYLKDTYDFVDGKSISEPLGIWSKNRVLNKVETGVYMSSYLAEYYGHLARYYSGFVPVFNSDFRNWQKKHNSGGDFIVFSDIWWENPATEYREILLRGFV